MERFFKILLVCLNSKKQVNTKKVFTLHNKMVQNHRLGDSYIKFGQILKMFRSGAAVKSYDKVMK